MKITQKDVDTLLAELRACNFTGLPGDLKPQIDAILNKLTNSPYYTEMVQAIKGEGLKHTLLSADTTDKGELITQAMGTSIQLGIMAGAIFGFRLGERNAGLELGLGVDTDAAKEAK